MWVGAEIKNLRCGIIGQDEAHVGEAAGEFSYCANEADIINHERLDGIAGGGCESNGGSIVSVAGLDVATKTLTGLVVTGADDAGADLTE